MCSMDCKLFYSSLGSEAFSRTSRDHGLFVIVVTNGVMAERAFATRACIIRSFRVLRGSMIIFHLRAACSSRFY